MGGYDEKGPICLKIILRSSRRESKATLGAGGSPEEKRYIEVWEKLGFPYTVKKRKGINAETLKRKESTEEVASLRFTPGGTKRTKVAQRKGVIMYVALLPILGRVTRHAARRRRRKEWIKRTRRMKHHPTKNTPKKNSPKKKSPPKKPRRRILFELHKE